ncbi:hypothetical protein E3N88_34575 [Mikania micrantha]|uniref:VAN3-binding protein-like auxin canalisation domain-containing protein n=1 Tax=Mikania micrantha TaxID=192012 RepID=A0A5N6LYI9_9ASTR|nr:hypothetical protein E3N88_34575 [Mikania micrantha]
MEAAAAVFVVANLAVVLADLAVVASDLAVQKIKKTSYRLEENRPKNNEIKILNSGTLHVSRRTSETLSRSDSRDFSEGSTSEVSASTPISADFSEHTSSSSSSSSIHSSPCVPFDPQMAARRTVHQQATAGFTGLNNPITPPPIPNENSW